MNNIINIFNIEDEDVFVVDTHTVQDTKYIVVEKRLKSTYCPCCSSIMHSKGIYVRNVNHSMLQDGFKLIIQLRERKWKCTNPDCNHYMMDEFSFAPKYSRQSSFLPYMIINALKDHNKTIAEVARRFNVSDTYAHEIFMSYLDIQRLPLPEILCVDEVYLDIDRSTKYSCVLMDFKSGEIVDILPNRWKNTLDDYFYSISSEERKNVKYVICDMYDNYVSFKDDYFYGSTVIIDSFHVISQLQSRLNTYLNSVKRKYQQRDKKLLKEKNLKNNTDYKSQKKSREVCILNSFSFFLLKDKNSITYTTEKKYNKILKYNADTYDMEKEFYNLDDNFQILSEYKQKYIDFNRKNHGSAKNAEPEFDQLIVDFEKTGNGILVEFARLLRRYRTQILASFDYYEFSAGEVRRLSNGPMEGFNRKPKDMKRDARGFEVFEYVRARLIFSSRKNVPVKSVPKTKKEIPRSKKAYRYNKK